MAEEERTDRYSRQEDLVPPDKHERCVVIGCGAVGRNVIRYLASMGVPEMDIFDFDDVEEHNVVTQMFNESDIGKTKVEACDEMAKAINKDIIVRPNYCPFDSDSGLSALVNAAVFCCADKMAVREDVHKAAEKTAVFFCDARVLGESIRYLAYNTQDGADIYSQTLYSDEDAESGRCTSKMTCYSAGVAAGLLCSNYARHMRGWPLDNNKMFLLPLADICEPDLEPPKQEPETWDQMVV